MVLLVFVCDWFVISLWWFVWIVLVLVFNSVVLGVLIWCLLLLAFSCLYCLIVWGFGLIGCLFERFVGSFMCCFSCVVLFYVLWMFGFVLLVFGEVLFCCVFLVWCLLFVPACFVWIGLLVFALDFGCLFCFG